MSEVRVKSLPWLQARLAQWQRCCRMQDWEIKLEIVRAREMEKPRTGENIIWGRHRFAEIRLQDPTDHDSSRDWDYDMEHTLAHEFAHLLTYYWPLPNDDRSVEASECERAMENIACGLCAIPVDFEVTEES